MIDFLEDEPIVDEIRDLIKGIDSVKDEVNVYCEMMKQMFLSNSNKN